METTTTETEKILLWVDKKGMEIEKKKMMKAAVDLNGFIKASEKLIGPIDDLQREELRKKGIEYIINEVKKRFQFPEATEEFNLQALGINLTEVKSKFSRSWKSYDFEITHNGDYILQNDQKILDNFNYYAKDGYQKDALQLVADLNNIAQRLEALGGKVDCFNGQVIFRSMMFKYPENQKERIGIDKKEVALLGRDIQY